MTSYTPKGNYPYPDYTDPVTAYPGVASTFAGYLDNLPNRNRIINGTFDIWQRGTSFSSPATGTYTADRWRLAYDGAGGTRVVSQVAGGAGFPGAMFPKYVMQIAISNRGTATTQTISQRIEDARTFAYEYITISAYVRTTSGTLNIAVKSSQNYGTGGSPTASVNTTHGTFSATTSWQRLSYTAQLGPASGTFGTNGDDFLEILFDLGSQTGTLQIWGVQVEQGVSRTALERRPIQQELALCQRYFYRHAPDGITYMSFIYAGSQHRLSLPLPQPMRSNVVLTGVTSSGWAGGNTPSSLGGDTRSSAVNFFSSAGSYYVSTGTIIDVNAEL